MEDHHHHQGTKSPGSNGGERSEPVRSRWTPKPEQILILESIFNSGMVNPPKDETVRIRKLLEKFGAVGDANVFYWFQNRRSRSRRRQRQMQAASLEQKTQQLQAQVAVAGLPSSAAGAAAFAGGSSYLPAGHGSSSSSSSCVGGQEGLGGFFSSGPTSHMGGGFPQIDRDASPPSVLYPCDADAAAANLNYAAGFGGSAAVSGFITVFVNGVATEVPRGPMDVKAAFGEDAVLVHSSGVPLPTNEFGFMMQGLQHGESYFLVSKQTSQG